MDDLWETIYYLMTLWISLTKESYGVLCGIILLDKQPLRWPHEGVDDKVEWVPSHNRSLKLNFDECLLGNKVWKDQVPSALVVHKD